MRVRCWCGAISLLVFGILRWITRLKHRWRRKKTFTAMPASCTVKAQGWSSCMFCRHVYIFAVFPWLSRGAGVKLKLFIEFRQFRCGFVALRSVKLCESTVAFGTTDCNHLHEQSPPKNPSKQLIGQSLYVGRAYAQLLFS